MKIWLSKNPEISIREQITTQITIGITSGDLRVGDRLPSTGELARRFKVHPNTIAAAYQALAEKGWLEFRQGSGFYVCETEMAEIGGARLLETLVTEFFFKARQNGFSQQEINLSLQKRLAAKNLPDICVVESDEHLRDILIEEIHAAVESLNIEGISFEKFEQGQCRPGSIIVALIDEKQKIENADFFPGNFVFLKSNSVVRSLIGQKRPAADEIIAVVSGWDNFLSMTKTVLIAADLPADCLSLRSTGEKNWRKGLGAASIIICDTLTAQKIAGYAGLRPFYLIAEDSLNELRKLLDN